DAGDRAGERQAARRTQGRRSQRLVRRAAFRYGKPLQDLRGEFPRRRSSAPDHRGGAADRRCGAVCGLASMSGHPEPCIFIVFGATGDLMRRKLIPALYRLALEELLPPACRILGVARGTDIDDAKYRAW